MRILLLTISLFCASITSVFAEIRNALVIGNGSYQQVGALSNPTNDAALMSSTLKGLGFNVIEVIDATQVEMKRAVRDFGTALNTAGREGIGLFYYAGHGVQVGGANYIIPVDAVIDKEGDVDIEAINANSVLSMMEFSSARLSFVILDACRNNPYSRGFRSSTRGLAKMNAPTGSMIAYATSPGDVAVDGAGKNSPYTASLVSAMTESGVPIEKMFRNVRNDVRSMTNNKQTPWESSSLIGDDFYFNTTVEVTNTQTGQEITVTTEALPKSEGEVDTAIAASSTSTIQPVVIKNDNNIELIFWGSVKDSKNPAVLQAYINKYPDGIFVELAKLKIDALEAQATPKQVQSATEVAVTATPKAESKIVAATKPIKLAAVNDDPLREKLNQCEAHFNANRLTTGKGGNALDCFSEVLQRQVGNTQAMRGLVKIEQRYADWARRDISRGNIKRATRNINKLRSVNEDNAVLEALEASLDELIEQQQVLTESLQPAPVVKVASTADPLPANAPVNNTARCDGLLDAGRLLGRGEKNALSCYRAVMAEDPDNSEALKGIRKIEDALFEEFTYNVETDKSVRLAEGKMRDMRRVNPDSKYMRKMRRLYDELKMEMRW